MISQKEIKDTITYDFVTLEDYKGDVLGKEKKFEQLKSNDFHFAIQSTNQPKVKATEEL